MLRSMTGFGKGVAENRLATIKIEIKSLNYKFFEVVSRLPANLTAFEDNVREYLQKRISRGRLNVFLAYDKKESGQSDIFVDKKTARQYYNMISELKKSLGLVGEIKIEQLIALPGVVAYRPQAEDAKRLWPLIEKALERACADLIYSKKREGAMLRKNLMHIIKSMSVSLAKIERRAPFVVKEYRQRLLNNVKELTSAKRILNPARIEEEAAIFARNCDIAEEIQRFTSHILSFQKALANHDEVGRRLDFIAQEMFREINTVGAKANDFNISKEVIKTKSLIEKIREQVQNVE